ncbi:MAG: hypothetical protein ACT4O1_01115 [Gemmatimonadota bacterium]
MGVYLQSRANFSRKQFACGSRRLSPVLIGALVASLGCDSSRLTEPEETNRLAVHVSSRTASGIEALQETISELEAIALDPVRRQHSYFGSNKKPNATIDDILSNLKAFLSSAVNAEDGVNTASQVASMDPWVDGISYITVNYYDTGFRDAKYIAYTFCNECDWRDTPYGYMRVRQYLGEFRTFAQDYQYSGHSGYSMGEVLVTNSGDPQSGMLSTDHWIDVWLGFDPHYYSTASGQV